MIWWMYGLAWAIGFAASLGVMGKLGEKNRSTIGDSFSGDDKLDALCAATWPAFWPCYLAFQLAAGAVR